MLEGEHVRLTPLTSDDMPMMFEWINDRRGVLHSAAYRPVHPVSHETWFQDIQRRKDVVIFGIRLIETDELIGSCQLLNIRAVHRCAELQIRIGPADARGRGNGSEAVGLLLKFAFCDLNLHRIWLHVLGTNARAIRVYEKSGFVREGVLREAVHIDGGYVDLVVMGILRADAAPIMQTAPAPRP